MILLDTALLTKEAFKPYGDVIETEGSAAFGINNNTTSRFHDLARIELAGENARTLVSIARCQPFSLPVEVAMMERHPLGSQAFIPLNDQPFLVVVAQDQNGKPHNPVAFLASGNQGINYLTNIWHSTLTALAGPGNFLMIDRGGDGNNLEEHFFEQSFQITALPENG